MKTIFILPNLGAGGAERVVTLLSRYFVSVGTEVDIYLMFSELVQYELPEEVGLVMLGFGALSKKERIFQLRSRLKAEKDRHQRLVVIPFQDSCLKYALAASLGLNIPVIASERNNPFLKGTGFLRRCKASLLYLSASACVFQTTGARDYYCRAVQKKSEIIANPLQLEARLRWHGQNSTRIISVGRLESQKNQSLLLDSFSEIHQKYPQYTLEIYGEGALREELTEKIAALHLENVVFLPGVVDDVHDRMASAVMFVLSSDYEGMSNALLEALAIGVPVISTDHPIGGASAVIQSGVNGILVPVGDRKSMAEAMTAVIADPGMRAVLSESAKKINQKLSLDIIAQRWLALLDSVFHDKGL